MGESIAERGAMVVSVYGPFNCRALVEMPAALAHELFDGDLGQHGPHSVVDAVEGELAGMPDTAAESTAAAVAVTLARELEHPYNSATSKSMCAGRLNETMAILAGMAPPEEEGDALDGLRTGFAADAGSATPASSVGS